MISPYIKKENYQEEYRNGFFQGLGKLNPIGSKNFRSTQKFPEQSVAFRLTSEVVKPDIFLRNTHFVQHF